MKTRKKYNSIFILLLCFILFTINSTTIEAFTKTPGTEIPTTELPVLTEQPAISETPIPLSQPALEIKKIEVSFIEQTTNLTNPIIITSNDTNDFNNKINALKDKLKLVTGITNIDTQVTLTLDTLITDSIQLNKSGKYEITATFKIYGASENTQNYYLSEDAATLKIPVYILDHDYFNFNEIIETDETIEFVWKNIPAPDYPVQLYFRAFNNLETSFYKYFFDSGKDTIERTIFNELSDSSLAEIQNNHLIIKKNTLTDGTNYCFFIKNQNYDSNIIHIKANGSSIQYNFISSSLLASLLAIKNAAQSAAVIATLSDFEEPDIIQAPPDETAVIDTSVSASDLKQDNIKTRKLKKQTRKTIAPASQPVIPQEEVTDTKTKISGTRLNYMLQIYPDYVPFEHQGILLRIPAEFLKNLGISETSYLTVEIKKEDDFSFSIMITIDGNEITEIPCAQIQFPIITDHKLLLYYNNNLTALTVTYQNNMAIFEIHNTGHYKLEPITEEASPSADIAMSSFNSGNESLIQMENIVIVIIGILIFIALILISLYRHRKEYQ